MKTPRYWSLLPPPEKRPDLGNTMRQISYAWNSRRAGLVGLKYLKPDCDLRRIYQQDHERLTWQIRRDIALLRFEMDNPPPWVKNRHKNNSLTQQKD